MVQDACIKYPDKIIISIDSKDNYVSVEGWVKPTGIIAIDLARRFEDRVIAAGGISSIKDIEQFLPLEELGVCGIITGRALYDGSIALEEAIDILNK